VQVTALGLPVISSPRKPRQPCVHFLAEESFEGQGCAVPLNSRPQVLGERLKAAFTKYYCCPDLPISLRLGGPLVNGPGHFRWGDGRVCYGRTASGHVSASATGNLYDALDDTASRNSEVMLPFDPDEVIENLQWERYSEHSRSSESVKDKAIRSIYYAVRPLLGVALRKHLQRMRLRAWKSLAFPRWPVDCTVEMIQQQLMALAIRASGAESIPFIWFWPRGYRGCIIVTHDVETAYGRDLCGDLMDVDDSFGFKASFQVVPESRYEVPRSYLNEIKRRGFEVNVHDLSHDGRLFNEQTEFLRRARRINQHAKAFGASGFRAAVLYRNPEWLSELEFDYDMSIPNVAHLDPQRGGCCTVLPYFIDDMVELPLTSIQDYALFHFLGDYSTKLWEQQIEAILQQNGLITILVHPDYVLEKRARSTYEALLRHLACVREERNLWAPLPRDVAAWWRQRSKMKLVKHGQSWVIEGEGKEDAVIAYARLEGDHVVYSLGSPGHQQALQVANGTEDIRCIG